MEYDRGSKLSRFTRLSLGWAIVDAAICGYDGPTIRWQPSPVQQPRLLDRCDQVTFGVVAENCIIGSAIKRDVSLLN